MTPFHVGEFWVEKGLIRQNGSLINNPDKSFPAACLSSERQDAGVAKSGNTRQRVIAM